MQIRRLRQVSRILAVTGGILLSIALGLGCLRRSLSPTEAQARFSLGEPLARLSYDLPFLWRATADTHEITIVYLDEYSASLLNQPLDYLWDRDLQVRLLDRLTQDQARLVLYDILFNTVREAPSDAAFAQSIRRNGKVVLGAIDETTELQGISLDQIVPPIPLLRKAAAGYGHLVFRELSIDYGVRRMYLSSINRVVTATWRAAKLLGAKITVQDPDTLQPFWVNYYGPRGSFRSVSLAQVLDPHGLAPGYFKNEIVLIGGKLGVGTGQVGRDEFTTPYSRLNGGFTPGTEVHANILLNLLRGEWLTRMPVTNETTLIVLFGLVAGALAFLRPAWASLAALVVVMAIACAACMLVWRERIWFAWCIPVGIQIPFGLAWSVSSQYLLESRRRKELRKAFGFYLSPQMADLIADSDFDLHPGGKVVEATVIFTDLESFTTISEDLDPAEVSALLIAYFEQTTRCILKNKGTIIKYVGDAVMAAWGAPIDEPAHAICATEAACDLRCLSEVEVRGKKLRTRVGVHSGKVLAGNLGSSFRFDYTMIGDTTNFASRLESLNKYLGTQVLISEAVRGQLEDKFISRRLGEFQVAGKTHSVIIHELLCRCDAENGEAAWIEVFEAGLDDFKRGEFAGAADLMKQTRKLRGGSDGPAEFYLRRIAKLSAQEKEENWDGVIELSEK